MHLICFIVVLSAPKTVPAAQSIFNKDLLSKDLFQLLTIASRLSINSVLFTPPL